jgi:hypothetical protein
MAGVSIAWMRRFYRTVLLAAACLAALPLAGQSVPAFRDLFNGKDPKGWVNVNTDEDTWTVKEGVLICKGQPIGVIRSDKQYENSSCISNGSTSKQAGPGFSSGVTRSPARRIVCRVESK